VTEFEFLKIISTENFELPEVSIGTSNNTA
jgi:hypothetical protein